jgi:serine/threonine protein kinase/tetratricopeptide (TPR) repeat protein
MTRIEDQARSIFLAALERAPDQWPACLDEACGANTELRARVDQLLHAHQALGSIHGGEGDSQVATIDEPMRERPGAVVGPYKLLQQIGEGGMGIVFMAEQTQPVQRKVALKIIKPGMDSRQVIARFEAERQALALMDHPNIAKVLDAGTIGESEPRPLGSGAAAIGRAEPLPYGRGSERPYFVMELVKGVPITKYCDEHRLTPKQRLELFVSVCQAVQHAHQKGIIHRDLKPSNVMVCLYDGKPVPKVIDFGVAKATGQKLTERTMFTEIGQVVGTLEYMSPEQAELNQLDIDTRSDIYSLGVLLYELLTGSTPLERKRVKKAAMLEVLRLIREEEPPRPSTRLSTTEEMPSVAASRGLEPKKLSGLVRGELDWIVMKALEKDRNRRYETANGFAMDIQRYLADEPVLACPPSAGYRLRKFARRHQGALTVGAAMLALLLAGTAVSTWQAVRATRAEKEASDALVQVTAEQANTRVALTAEIAAQAQTLEALDALTDDVVETMFARQPELEVTEKAFLRKVLGFYESITQRLGETAEARFLRAKGYFKVAHLSALLGQQIKAVAAYRQAEVLLGQLAEEFPDAPEYREKLARTDNNLGVLLAELGNEAEAETAFRHAVTLRAKLADKFPKVPPYGRDLAASYNDLAFLLQEQKNYAEADVAYRRALDLEEKLSAEAGAAPMYRQALARGRANLGSLLREQERYAEAEDSYRLALTVQEKQLAEFPRAPRVRRELADSYHGLGIVLAELKKETEAETTFDRSLALRKKLADDYPGVLQYRRELAKGYSDLGFLRQRQGKYADAEEAYRQALDLMEKIVAETGPNHRHRQDLAQAHHSLGIVLAEQKKEAEAETAFHDALELRKKLVEEFPRVQKYRRELALSYTDLGNLLQRQKKDAESAWRDALPLWQQLATDAPKVADYQNELAGTLGKLAALHNQRGEFVAAVVLLDQARPHQQAAVTASPKNPKYLLYSRNNLITLAQSHRNLADHVQLAMTADDLARLGNDPANDAYFAACILCTCVTLAEKDAQLDEVRRRELAQTYADRALALLRQAVVSGFKDAAHIKTNRDLEPLRAREEFRKLLADLEEKTKE